jgi:hypothetical protein
MIWLLPTPPLLSASYLFLDLTDGGGGGGGGRIIRDPESLVLYVINILCTLCAVAA